MPWRIALRRSKRRCASGDVIASLFAIFRGNLLLFSRTTAKFSWKMHEQEQFEFFKSFMHANHPIYALICSAHPIGCCLCALSPLSIGSGRVWVCLSLSAVLDCIRESTASDGRSIWGQHFYSKLLSARELWSGVSIGRLLSHFWHTFCGSRRTVIGPDCESQFFCN